MGSPGVRARYNRALIPYKCYQNLIINGLNVGENDYKDSIEMFLRMLTGDMMNAGIAEGMMIISYIYQLGSLEHLIRPSNSTNLDRNQVR